jgi:hypothetical protein
MTKRVLYRTELGAVNYAAKVKEEIDSVHSARSILLNLDPPQWTVHVRLKDGRMGWAMPNLKGVEVQT